MAEEDQQDLYLLQHRDGQLMYFQNYRIEYLLRQIEISHYQTTTAHLEQAIDPVVIVGH